MREWTSKNRDSINKRRRNNYLKNKPRIQQQQRIAYLKHRDERLHTRKLYREANHDDIIKYNENYRKSNPKKFLEYGKKYVKTHKLPHPRILLSWSNFIKSRDQVCQICGEKAEYAHHIIHRAKYPQLALNENNGISLCKKCHYEVHGRFK